VPVILPKAEIDRPFNFLQVLAWIDFSRVAQVSDPPSEVDRLVAAIQGGPPSSAEMLREALCSYRWLDAFREEEFGIFFGRGRSAEFLLAESPDDRRASGHLCRRTPL
jgi:hypothetical protein